MSRWMKSWEVNIDKLSPDWGTGYLDRGNVLRSGDVQGSGFLPDLLLNWKYNCPQSGYAIIITPYPNQGTP